MVFKYQFFFGPATINLCDVGIASKMSIYHLLLAAVSYFVQLTQPF